MLSEAIYMVQGDTLPKLECSLGINIAGFSFRLLVRLEDGTKLVKTGVISDAPAGAFYFQFGAADLPVGEHACEVEITDTFATVQTIPAKHSIPLRVRKASGSPEGPA